MVGHRKSSELGQEQLLSQEEVLRGVGMWILPQSQTEDSANNFSMTPSCRPFVPLLTLYPERVSARGLGNDSLSLD